MTVLDECPQQALASSAFGKSARSGEFYIGKAGAITTTEMQRKEGLEFLEDLLSKVRRESVLQIKNSVALLNTAK